MESAHHSLSKADCNNTADVPSFTLRNALSHLFLICVALYHDSRLVLQKLCRIPKNSQFQWLKVSSSAPGTSMSTSGSSGKFLLYIYIRFPTRETDVREDANSHKVIQCKYLTRSFLHGWIRGWSGFWCRFCTIMTLVLETALVFSRTLTFCSPLNTNSFNLWLSGNHRDAHRNLTKTTNNFVLCWLHHCTYRSEEQVQNDRKLYHSERENLMLSSSQDLTSTGKVVAVFSSQNRFNQDTFSDRDEFSLRRQQVFGSNEPLIRFSDPANVAKSLLEGNKDDSLSQARSELMKPEHKVEFLNTCMSALQAANLCSAIGIGGRPSRICRISKRASSTTRRVDHEGKCTRRHSD